MDLSERDTSTDILAEADLVRWQSYVDSHPSATLFHGMGWRQAVAGSFGHRPWYLAAKRAGRIVGALPLFEINSVIAGRMLVSMPYATYGGVLADDAEAKRSLLTRARAIAEMIGARCVELRSMEAADPDAEIRRSHATFRRTLPQTTDDVLAMYPRKARAAARRAAERYELSVSFGDEHLWTVWRLYARSMRRLGSPNYPYRFFRELVAAMSGRHCVQVIRHRDKAIGGLLSFVHRDIAMPYFVGVHERADVYGLNNYLYWESMKWAVKSGCRVYDFGRTRIDNTGPFEFKRSFGFEPQVLEYQTMIMAGRAAPDLSPTSPRWSRARRLWKALPLPVTRPLGAWLARSIPG